MAYAAHGLNILSECASKTGDEPLCWLIGPAELLEGLSESELRDRAACLRDWQQRTSSWDRIAARLGEALQLDRETRASGQSCPFHEADQAASS